MNQSMRLKIKTQVIDSIKQKEINYKNQFFKSPDKSYMNTWISMVLCEIAQAETIEEMRNTFKNCGINLDSI